MLVLKINAVDRSDQVEWPSFKKVEVLSKEPDVLEFRLRLYPTKTFRPSLNDEVIVELDSERIFGGTIVETEERVDGKLTFLRVICKDFTYTLDRQLVTRRYEAFGTADDIIDDIVSSFVEAGFTTNNVNAPVTVDDINFNHFYVSDALQKLADYIGFEWFVDYFKDINFFSREQTSAPFNLNDISGDFNWNSLQNNEHIHQLRNKITVRGGTLTGNERTRPYVADGTQKIFYVGISHINMTVEKNSVAQTLGKEGVDDDDVSIAVLYNPNSGHIAFKVAPSNGDTVDITSSPSFPLIKVFKDNTSISQFGEFEMVIVDKTIKSSEAATLRARAELIKWADEIRELTFETHTDGLRIGQLMNVNLPSRNINRNYIVNRINVSTRSAEGDMLYEVSLLASERITFIDILSDLLINRPNIEIAILEDEIIDLVEGFSEEIDFQESFVATVFPRAIPTFAEIITYGGDINSFRINPFNPPIFVAGPTFPVDDNDDERTPNADSTAEAT